MTRHCEVLPSYERPNRALWRLVLLLGILGAGPSHAQTPPGTDIWVFRVDQGGSAVDVASGVRATERPGYDNQPGFLPGGRFLLFTSIDESGQADIHRFDLHAGIAQPLTRTAPESEYSATLMPSGDRISVVRVEADSAQRLWSFDLDGGTPEVLLEDIRPVGYHAWIDGERLALFVLGSPATLQVASARTGRSEVVSRDIGRSLHKVPGKEAVSFVQWGENQGGSIVELDPSSGGTRVLAPLLDGNEFYAWTPSGTLVMGQGSKLFRFTPGSSQAWEELADLEPAGVRGISRIAVSPEGDRIAVVGVGG
ncbi:MAG: TolB family protein [Longimicrobiales bacterium]